MLHMEGKLAQADGGNERACDVLCLRCSLYECLIQQRRLRRDKTTRQRVLYLGMATKLTPSPASMPRGLMPSLGGKALGWKLHGFHASLELPK